MRGFAASPYGIPPERVIGSSNALTGPGRPALRLVVAHDDPDREPAYTAGAERVLEAARSQEGWAVVSVRHDWSRVFAGG